MTCSDKPTRITKGIALAAERARHADDRVVDRRESETAAAHRLTSADSMRARHASGFVKLGLFTHAGSLAERDMSQTPPCVARDRTTGSGELPLRAATASSGVHLNAGKTALSCRSANRRFQPDADIQRDTIRAPLDLHSSCSSDGDR